MHAGFGPEGAGEGDLGARAPGSPCSSLRILELILAPEGLGAATTSSQLSPFGLQSSGSEMSSLQEHLLSSLGFQFFLHQQL